jgi:hypothetical protein
MAIRILEIDRPTNRGNIYPRAVVEVALAKHIAKLGANQMGIFRGINISQEDMVGVAENLRIEDGYLVADVKLVDTWVNEMVAKGSRNFCLRPIGHGIADPNTGILLEGYEFHALTVRMPPETYEKN